MYKYFCVFQEEIAKLLRFESSHKDNDVRVGLEDYISRITGDHKTIFYLSAPRWVQTKAKQHSLFIFNFSRHLAESSPYYESLKAKQQEVLFCYDPYDELVLMQLQQFKNYKLLSVEKDMRDDASASDLTNLGNSFLYLNTDLHVYIF